MRTLVFSSWTIYTWEKHKLKFMEKIPLNSYPFITLHSKFLKEPLKTSLAFINHFRYRGMQALESSRPSPAAASRPWNEPLGAMVCSRARVSKSSSDTSLCHLPWSQTFPSVFLSGKQAWELVIGGINAWPAHRAIVKKEMITKVKVLSKMQSPDEVIYCINSSCSDRSQSLVSSWENLVLVSWCSYLRESLSSRL